MEWQYACNALADVCSKMSGQLIPSKPELSQEDLSCEQDIHLEWKHRFSALEKEFLSRDEVRNTEIEKLRSENGWLQHRLSEKLQQTRHQNDIIDELKRDLIESVQQTEISEGRRLCYEHKIKILEEQLDKLTLSRIPETDMFEQGSKESLLKQQEIIDLNKAMTSLHQKKADQDKKYQEEIARLSLELQSYRQTACINTESAKLLQIQNELVQKKKEVALLQDLVEEQYCQIQRLNKELGFEDVLNVSHLKQLLGRDLDCNSTECAQESKCSGLVE
ncbi:hypothetical protein SBV42_02645 [Chlamydia crocodili]|uniref:Myosin heavy chain n=1 Tax=Chlamydia crocodili TaxID=2766982 RepID=A0ABX8CGM1_9CHLA|nr:hypothetical protein [Chlamydia crocodili]QVE49604.1 hypothetical protein H9Q19_03020 [Chlamydia crocodili]